jgi:DNA-directed RNA polymerase specialized sigma24 family protein
MELDDPFVDELGKRRAEVDERQEQLDEALRQLRLAGRSAFAELRAAGHTSAMIARGTDMDSSTIRKLNSDGDKPGWRPLSRESYAALDAYIR